MTSQLHTKFTAAMDAIKAQFVERDHIIDGMGACLISGQHALLMGPPGTGKSALARAVSSIVVDFEFWQWLLTRFTPLEEVIGPMSLKGLENDVFRRITTGKLPEAHIAFLDEIFKANSSILNALLTLLNERLMFNDGKPVKAPLWMAVGASNEYPDGDGLGALYDRFLGRWWVSEIGDRDNLRAMLSRREPGPIDPSVKLTMSEMEAIRAEVAGVAFTRGDLDMLLQVKDACAAEGIVASDRRWRQITRYLRAVAWVDGQSAVSEDHFAALSDVLWREHTERPAVMRTVGKVASPIMVEATELFDAIKEMAKDAARKSGEEPLAWSMRIAGVASEIRKANGKLRLLADGTTKARIKKMADECAKVESDLRAEAVRSAGL